MSIRSLSSCLVLAILLAAMGLSGCLGAGVDTAQCNKFSGSQKDDCINFLAVWSLSPETCYQIQSMALRETCLVDSNTPDTSQMLQDRWYASGQGFGSASVKTTPAASATEAVNSTPVQPVAPPVVAAASADEQIAKCVASNPKYVPDTCARQLAIDNLDLNYCVLVTSPDLRQSCIVAVATNLKNMAACDVFKASADKQFCVYYSRGS